MEKHIRLAEYLGLSRETERKTELPSRSRFAKTGWISGISADTIGRRLIYRFSFGNGAIGADWGAHANVSTENGVDFRYTNEFSFESTSLEINLSVNRIFENESRNRRKYHLHKVAQIRFLRETQLFMSNFLGIFFMFQLLQNFSKMVVWIVYFLSVNSQRRVFRRVLSYILFYSGNNGDFEIAITLSFWHFQTKTKLFPQTVILMKYNTELRFVVLFFENFIKIIDIQF